MTATAVALLMVGNVALDAAEGWHLDGWSARAVVSILSLIHI